MTKARLSSSSDSPLRQVCNRALSRFAAAEDANAEAARAWLAKWVPLGDAAIDAFCAHLPDGDDAATQARNAAAGFRADLPFAL